MLLFGEIGTETVLFCAGSVLLEVLKSADGGAEEE